MKTIEGTKGTYEIIELVGRNPAYRLYSCIPTGTNRQCLLQIAAKTEDNGKLERFAFILGELKGKSDEIEAEYAKVRTDPKILINYALGFPELVDSFIFENQGNRRVNILAFKGVEEVIQMVPLSNITAKDRQRVDLRTSAWIIGKLIKLLIFAHEVNFSVDLQSGKNILIEPNRHYVLIFDWTLSQIFADIIPREMRRQNICQAAKAVITALGGDPETETFPADIIDDKTRVYTDYLLQLARGSESDTQEAHKDIYAIIDALWERKYYPFTTFELIELD